MALNIQPSSDSSASSSSQSSSKKSSSTDLFAQGMKATAAKQPAPKPAKPAGTPKPKHSDDDSQTKSAAKSVSKPQQPSAASQAAQSTDDTSAPDDAAAAAAAEANAVAAKGRMPARTLPKSAPSQDVTAKNAEDTSTDPDSTTQSGLSLLQLLAKKLASQDTDTPSTDAAAPAATDKSGTDATDETSSDDPNAIALSMFSQALAAALARQQSPTANVASAAAGRAATGITSVTDSPGGADSMQDLMSVLAKDVAADAKSKSDDGAAQFDVDPTKAAASDDSGSTDTSAIGPNALAHLGVASHFAAQHLLSDTNAADLKSPVGSSAWQDEVGTHLTWMTQKGLETGSLRVTPEHLGPVEVNISVQNGDASVWFAANHPDTRAALEQALPRLREMFANQGMNLADSGVSRQSLSQQGSRNQSRPGASQGVTGVSAVGAADGSSAAAARINLGLVDLYA